MTDIALGLDNDLLLQNGKISLIETLDALVRQRLLNKLRAFTGTLFTNINYGIKANLVFNKGTQSLLDQDIKTLISNTDGVVKLISYSSVVNEQRLNTINFTYEITNGEQIDVSGLSITGAGPQTVIEEEAADGIWDYTGVWNNTGVFGV
jgi:hypothetical protein